MIFSWVRGIPLLCPSSLTCCAGGFGFGTAPVNQRDDFTVAKEFAEDTKCSALEEIPAWLLSRLALVFNPL